MTLYRRSDRLDELDRWFDITLRWQFMVGVNTFVNPMGDKPCRGWIFCLGPFTAMWTYPIKPTVNAALQDQDA